MAKCNMCNGELDRLELGDIDFTPKREIIIRFACHSCKKIFTHYYPIVEAQEQPHEVKLGRKKK